MAISTNWLSLIVTIPQADLVFVGGDDYEMDIEWLRRELHLIEWSEIGQSKLRIHRRIDPYVISGVTYTQAIEIINGYLIEFEQTGSPYRVRLLGGNTNVGDVAILNGVQIVPSNSAGQTTVAGSGGQLDGRLGFR